MEESKRVIALAMRKLDSELNLPVSSEELNTKQADIAKWLESAQAEKANLRARVENIKKAIIENHDSSSIHLRELVENMVYLPWWSRVKPMKRIA